MPLSISVDAECVDTMQSFISILETVDIIATIRYDTIERV